MIRIVLLPALMLLLGDRVWHVPKWLDRILPELDVEGEEHAPDRGRRRRLGRLAAAAAAPYS